MRDSQRVEDSLRDSDVWMSLKLISQRTEIPTGRVYLALMELVRDKKVKQRQASRGSQFRIIP